MSWGGAAVHIAEGVLGVTLLYLRFFLYESEEGRLQNALVDLWVRIAERADTTFERFRRLMDVTARISLQFLERLFGPNVISFQAFAVSSAFALASSGFSILWASRGEYDLSGWAWSLALDIATLMAAVAPALIRRSWAWWIPAGVTLTALALTIASIWLEAEGDSEVALGASTGLVAAILITPLVDFAWVVVSRLGTQWALHTPGLLPNLLVIAAGACITAASFFLLPHLGSDQQKALLSDAISSDIHAWFVFFLTCVGSTRLLLAAVSSIQLTLFLCAFAHWIIWPLLSRVVYAAERFNFFKERKWFGTLGGVLLIHASGSASWVITVLKALKLGE